MPRHPSARPGCLRGPWNLHHGTEVALDYGAGAGGRLLIVERWRGIIYGQQADKIGN